MLSPGGDSAKICERMNANAIEGAVAAAAGSQMPLYFRSGERGLFGWLHRSSQVPCSQWGAVLCKPFGYEALCGHRSLRAFAAATADLGIPALRFDYLGTGDSDDIDPNADQIEVWTQDIAHAVAELRRRTGVSRVCLMGFRLGALLAIRAARQCEAHALALVAPVLSGRRYLREVRTLELAACAAEAALSARQPSSRSSASNRRAMEVNGYPLSDATLSSLPRTDGSVTDLAGLASLLVIDRSDLPVARDWAAAARASGVPTEYRVLSGFVEMLMTAPQFAKPAREMLQATREWLSRHCVSRTDARGTSGLATGDVAGDPSTEGQLLLPGHDDSPRALLRERPVVMDADSLLFGIVTEPRQDEPRRRAVILLNVGADDHIGASRMYVSLARRWARSGYYVLRLDLAGLGDSDARRGRPDNQVFPPDALEDIRAAVEFMRSRYRIREVTLGAEGALGALRPGSLVVDMTTSEPQLAKEIFEAAAAKGVGSLDAPVSGGDVGARNATLVVMAGGREEDFERVLPVFQCLGKTVTLEGGPGAGQHTKMANQIAIASGMVGVCEALLYASRAGLDVARVIDTIGPGAAGSWSLSNYGPRALRGDFEPGFKVDHFIKDLGIALAEARRMRVALPGLALAEQLYVATSARGLGEKGTHSLLLALSELAGASWGGSDAPGRGQVPGK